MNADFKVILIECCFTHSFLLFVCGAVCIERPCLIEFNKRPRDEPTRFMWRCRKSAHFPGGVAAYKFSTYAYDVLLQNSSYASSHWVDPICFDLFFSIFDLLTTPRSSHTFHAFFFNYYHHFVIHMTQTLWIQFKYIIIIIIYQVPSNHFNKINIHVMTSSSLHSNEVEFLPKKIQNKLFFIPIGRFY